MYPEVQATEPSLWWPPFLHSPAVGRATHPSSPKPWPLVTEAGGLPSAPSVCLGTQRCSLLRLHYNLLISHKNPQPRLTGPCVTAETIHCLCVYNCMICWWVVGTVALGRLSNGSWVSQKRNQTASAHHEAAGPLHLSHCPPGTWSGGPMCGLGY